MALLLTHFFWIFYLSAHGDDADCVYELGAVTTVSF